MKAIRVARPGGPEVLFYEEVERPTPAAGQALVKVQAAGVNFLDIYHRTGMTPIPLPATLGQEAAGIVEATGPSVTEVKPRDRVVFSNVPGCYAEYVVAPAWRLVSIPRPVSIEQAAAAMLQGMTAHYLSHTTYPLRRGETALVHAAAGGVGALLVQMAKRLGARVIGTVSTEEKAAVARASGADEVIVYTRNDFESDVKRLTGGRGVEVVYDSVGKDTFEKSLNCLAPRGMLVLFGQASGRVPPVDPQLLNAKGSLFLTRPSLHHYTHAREELLQHASEVLSWVADGTLRLRIDRTFPLAQAAAAHAHLESRRALGKVLLMP